MGKIKLFISIFLLITFSCQALPWPLKDPTKSRHDSRIYLIQETRRNLWLFASNETGTITFDCRGKESNNDQKRLNIRISVSLFLPEEQHPETFSVVFLDESHEFLEKLDFQRKKSGNPWSISFSKKSCDLSKYRYFIFIF